ncbi:MAG: NRDE family protein [Myxococcales bacterium]|nr:NRDE family protein [Myxococcales bacterium]
MCTLLFAHRAHPDLPLVIAANRDEFYGRETAPADRWRDAPGVIGGRDLEGGGTWLAVHEDGRWAALTNVREPGRVIAGAPSRGALVRDFLIEKRRTPGAYVVDVEAKKAAYNGFNLVVGDFAAGTVFYVSNRGGPPTPVMPGVHGVSNALLDSAWPKVTRGRHRLAAVVARGASLEERDIFALLGDKTQAPDDELPDTGVGLEWERRLSPIFLQLDGVDYGTCSSTLVTVTAGGTVRFVERTVSPRASAGERWFTLAAPAR